MEMNDFSRQMNIFNPDEFTLPVHIIGAGATGSWVTLVLAKMGVKNITVYDFDEVGMHNLPNQMFGLENIGQNKALSIQSIVKKLTGFDVKYSTTKINGGELFQGVVFVLTDTMRSRKDIYNMSIKYNPNVKLLIETRTDLRGFRVYALDPKNAEAKKKYEETLYNDDESEVSSCGVSQTLLPTSLGAVSYAVWAMINSVNDVKYVNETLVDMENNYIIGSEWGNEGNKEQE